MKRLMMAVLLSFVTVPAWAQESGDAPEHGVARISAMSGDVTVRRGDSGEDVAGEVNAPLVALDHVFTNKDSRAELQFDSTNFLRLAPDGEVRLAELADRNYLVQLSSGTLTFRVLDGSDAQTEISTPNISIRPSQKGTYRVTVYDEGHTEVTVRSGEAEIYVGGKSDRLRAGQTLIVSGDAANPQQSYDLTIPLDDWDRWNDARDRDHDRSDSYKYVNRHIDGADALYGYGRWVYDPPYGYVWAPNVAVDWAPYRVGRWVWVDFYGWTWVSGDPWGWAPYHYGRWYHTAAYGWVWYPGEPQVRHYWRPALVVFFGWGTNVGWVPLAPREVYHPWYGPNRTVVVTNTTVVNNINVVTTYRNAHYVSNRNGVTSVVSGDFGRRNITINNYVISKNHELEHAGDARRWLPKEPSRENRQFSNRVATVYKPSHPDVDRHFVSHPDRPNHDANQDRHDDRQVSRGDNRGNARVHPDTDGARRGNDPERTDTVMFPRNNQGRGQQSDNKPGRGNVSSTPQTTQAQPNADGARRGNDPKRPEMVSFPRNDQGRGQQSDNKAGRGNAPSTAQDTRVPNPSASSAQTRRTDATAYRTDGTQQKEVGRDKNNDFVRAPAQARRDTPGTASSQPSEGSHKSEPVVKRGADSAPVKTAQASREQSREHSAPQASAKSKQKEKEEDKSDSGDHGKGRER
jgi:hypothetical protein